MEIAPSLDKFVLFIILVLPGLISMHIYRLFIPAKDIDWKNSIFEALFYSSINFGLLLPLIIPIHKKGFSTSHPFIYIMGMVVIIFVGPIIWPYIWTKLLKSKFLKARFQLPFPTAWDFFFSKRKSAFVLIHLTNGNKIGGYYGPNSYATSYPREGDIFIEKSIRVDQNGRFLEVISDSCGFLIRKNEYELIEFFKTKYDKSVKKGDSNG